MYRHGDNKSGESIVRVRWSNKSGDHDTGDEIFFPLSCPGIVWKLLFSLDGIHGSFDGNKQIFLFRSYEYCTYRYEFSNHLAEQMFPNR